MKTLTYCLTCLAMVLAMAGVPPVHGEDLIDRRLAELEDETQRLRSQLQQLQQDRPVRLPEVTARPATLQTAPAAEDDVEYYTLDELKAEMKKFAWTKGDFTIVPYGYLWAWTVYETEESVTGDYALYIRSVEDDGSHNWDFDARGTRLGLDVAGPRLPSWGNATTGGKVEIDFQGDFVQENKGGVLLRHAYVEVKNEYYRLLLGQTWDVISPRVPGVLLYSVAWGAGNIGYRRAQLRGERYYHLSDTSMLIVQGSLNETLASDFNDLNIPRHGDWPVIQGRLAWRLGPRGKGCHPWEFGVSSHIGSQLWHFNGGMPDHDRYLRTWSLNFDAKIPLTDRFGVQGEVFTGENLGPFLGGIVQGVNTDQRETIRSSGGWFDVWYDWTDRLHSHAGYFIDDPFNQDLSAGQRAYNQMYFANLSYDVTRQFMIGIEGSQWDTHYVGKRPGSSFRVELMAKYAF